MRIKSDFKTYHHEVYQQLEHELKAISSNRTTVIKKDFQDLEKVHTRFVESLFGGKMIRGTLVKLGYELVSKKETKEILKPAAAFEIFHSALLIHDDVIDASPLRRGKPTVYMQERDKQLGISQAICLGDLGITLAVRILAESNFPPERKNNALSYFLTMISQTILGEMLDIQSAQTYERTEQQVMKVHLMKTANYTIVGPLTVGAILAGGDETLLENIKRFGEKVGVAFQIQDDILGVFGDNTEIGKSTTSDIEENKSTLFITYCLKHANAKQKAFLKSYYGKKDITKKHYEEIKTIFVTTGALTYCQNKIAELTAEAKKIIPSLTKDKTKQKLLAQFTDLLIKRNK